MDRRSRAAQRLFEHVGTLLESDLTVRLWTGAVIPLGAAAPGPVGISIASPNALSSLIRRPTLGTLIELLIHGAIDIEGGSLLDLDARRGRLRTRELFRRLDKGLLLRCLAPFLLGAGVPALASLRRGESHAARDDAASIRFHYDVSNDFYALFLDPEMQYSCAWFETPDATLAEAQQAKLDLVCRKLDLQPGDRFLDVGCGWGGLLCHAATRYGVTAHGVTLSEAQFRYTREKIERQGLSDRVTVALGDYTSVAGLYDKIASIEMAEHVGLANHGRYFRALHDRLAPSGLYLHQASARTAKKDERRFARHHPEYAAITRHVFPGAELDHIGMTLRNLQGHGFEVHDVLALREHMARTFEAWLQRLRQNEAAALAAVGPVTLRTWLLYLAGCALAFGRGGALVFQTLASKRTRGASAVSPTRSGFYPGPGAP